LETSQKSINYEKIIKRGKEVLQIEEKAIISLSEALDENFAKVVEIILNCKGRVAFSGMGKSGLVARKIVATLNSTGTPSFYLHPTDAVHGDLGMIRKEDVAILISKSGNTEEIVNLAPLLRRMGVPLIAITSFVDSKLAKECDITLNLNVKEEACPYDLAPTASTTATLALGDALAIALLEERGFSKEDFALLHPGGSLGKRLSLKISEIMYKGKDIPIVFLETPFKEVLYEITSKRLGVTCVVDKNGYLRGVITDGDLRRLLEKRTDVFNLTAGDFMTHNPKTVYKDYLASFALTQMEKYKITSLIVVDEKNIPIGIVHLHDLVNLGLQIR